MDLCAFFDGHKLAQSPVQCNQRDDVALLLTHFSSDATYHAAHQKLILEVPSLRSTSRRNCAFNLYAHDVRPGKCNQINSMNPGKNHRPAFRFLGLDN